MSILDMSDEEKKEILEKHKKATKDFYQKKDEAKGGPSIPDKKEEEKSD